MADQALRISLVALCLFVALMVAQQGERQVNKCQSAHNKVVNTLIHTTDPHYWKMGHIEACTYLVTYFSFLRSTQPKKWLWHFPLWLHHSTMITFLVLLHYSLFGEDSLFFYLHRRIMVWCFLCSELDARNVRFRREWLCCPKKYALSARSTVY